MLTAKEIDQFFSGEKFFGTIGIANFYSQLNRGNINKSPVSAYHVFSYSLYNKSAGTKLSLPEYLLLTMELSARLWKNYNGSISLITDCEGFQFLRECGLIDVYDSVIPVSDISFYGIDKYKFWAASKILALSIVKLPCVILDLDLLVWQKISFANCNLAVLHKEHINERFYPAFNHFIVSPHYHFPDEWKTSVEALNTSLLYMKDERLRDYYTSESIRFMQNERGTPDDGSVCMIFAEQRILAMCAALMNVKAKTFLRHDCLERKQPYFTHIWSGKNLMQQYPEIAQRYSEMCKHKISELLAV